MVQADQHLIAHLLRRAGFGSNPDELAAYTALGFEGAIDRLVNFDKVDDSEAEKAVALMHATNPASANVKHPEFGNPQVEVAAWLARMLLTKRPLQEKMTLFWHGHFASSIIDVKSAALMRRQNELFRAYALAGSFKDFTKAVARDPAMLIYLNNNTNRKNKPNENWARELMELFTLGTGNYTETDVKESARAFTGWTVDRNGSGQAVFHRNQHDTGTKTFMGHTGNFTGDDIIDIIFTQPAHPRLIASKLFSFFVYPYPREEVYNRFADIYSKAGFSIKDLVRQILLSPEFRAQSSRFAIIKSPAEFTVGSLRAMSAHFSDLRIWKGIDDSMSKMGQRLYAPPNVGGWPGNRNWMNSSAYYTRANLADQIVAVNNDATVDPVELAAKRGIQTPSAAVDYFLEILLQSDMPPEYRDTLLNYMGGRGGQQQWNGKLRGMVRLIMSSPAYQMN